MAMTQFGLQGDDRPVYLKVTEAHFERSQTWTRLSELGTQAFAGIRWYHQKYCREGFVGFVSKKQTNIHTDTDLSLIHI